MIPVSRKEVVMENIPPPIPEPRIPRIGDPAPAFEAETTFGPLQLGDFSGSWLVFFSHPADFTPVCTTEFIEFAKNYPRVQEAWH
jgi:peroxiredoxin (alkyl hydroperoxide reductase subunit C)